MIDHSRNITMIAAITKDNSIGRGGKLLYHIPEDMKNFKAVTTNNVVIMGRKTYESIGKPLPNRVNVILTHNEDYDVEGAMVVNSVDEAILYCKVFQPRRKIYVIGGEEIYKAFYTRAKYLNLTEIESDLSGDAKFPSKFRKQFRIVKSSMLMEDPDTKVKYRRNIYKQLFSD